MFKRHLLFVMLMVMAVASSQAGTWKLHSYYVTSKIQNIYDTGDKVYYMNSNNLFQFDKATLVTNLLSRQNLLSDVAVRQIFFDDENRLLFVAYANSNIDIIDANSNVFNVPNLKDVTPIAHQTTITDGMLTSYTSTVIKDITFGGGKAYVTYGYGFMVIDETTKRVIKNYDLGRNITVNSVTPVGSKLAILSNNYLYYGEPGEEYPITTYEKVQGTFDGNKLFAINDTSAFLLKSSTLYRYDFPEGQTPRTTKLLSIVPTTVQRTPSGFILNFAGKAYYYTADATGTTTTQASSVVGIASSDPAGDGTIWILDGNGLHVSGSTDYYMINSLTTNIPYWLKYNAAMNKLYAATSAPNMITTQDMKATNVVNTYDGVTWKKATPYSTEGGAYEFVFNPLDPTHYVRASWKKGVHRVKNDTHIGTYTSSNSPIGTYKAHPAFDNYGNLWVVSSFGYPSAPASVLTADKVAKTTVTKSDWFSPSGLTNLNTSSMMRSRFIISKKNNVKFYCDGDYPSTYAGRILCFDNDNVDPKVDTYHLRSIQHFVDQNNKQVDWLYLQHMEEDKEGLIWCGHTAGLFVFDPVVAFDLHPKAIRPYVTNFSEGKGYLCEGYSVYDIGVDRNNNKWIGTNNGLYYVSPDASEVFTHFTTENSDIPSDMVYTVECDTVNDRVYIITDNGFAEYIVNGDAATLNYNGTYAFPNPVEPDFTGMIKIAGLMDNSYLTITNKNGVVVAQIGPAMGSALWDGYGEDGERLPTGIYNVYAAQGAFPEPTGTPQTTIMIIK